MARVLAFVCSLLFSFLLPQTENSKQLVHYIIPLHVSDLLFRSYTEIVVICIWILKCKALITCCFTSAPKKNSSSTWIRRVECSNCLFLSVHTCGRKVQSISLVKMISCLMHVFECNLWLAADFIVLAKNEKLWEFVFSEKIRYIHFWYHGTGYAHTKHSAHIILVRHLPSVWGSKDWHLGQIQNCFVAWDRQVFNCHAIWCSLFLTDLNLWPMCLISYWSETLCWYFKGIRSLTCNFD